MNRIFLFLLFFLAHGVANAGCPIITDGSTQITTCDQTFSGSVIVTGVGSNFSTRTRGDITLYVRTTGSDGNDNMCLNVESPCLTISYALSRVPHYIDHQVVVDIGAGTFDGFVVSSFDIAYVGRLWIKGATGAPTLTTGTATGTATGGDIDTCTDSGQEWTANELRGKIVEIGTEYMVITGNTETSMELAGRLSGSCSGEDYSIVEQKTTINPIVLGNFGTGAVLVNNMRCAGIPVDPTDHKWSVDLGSYVIRDFKMSNASADFGIAVINTGGGIIDRNYVDGSDKDAASLGIWVRDIDIPMYVRHNFATGWEHGIRVESVRNMESMYGNYTYGNEMGVRVKHAKTVQLDDMVAESNTQRGISLINVSYALGGYVKSNNNGIGFCTRNSTSVKVTNGSMSNNTLFGVALENSFLRIRSMSGTGNGQFGLYVNVDATAVIDDTTSVTGSSGDATLNGGVTALDWGVDFPDNGDIVVNLDTGARCERDDTGSDDE